MMDPKKKVLAVGCSYTRGHGLTNESMDPFLWVNSLFPHDAHTVNNVSKTGANNQWIFLETMSQLMKNNYDIVLVGWTAIPRFNFCVGLELYSTSTMLTNVDVNINNKQTISGKWLKSIGDGLRKIHNDHWNLLDLVKYVNILIKIQKQAGGEIFFVNALGPWSNEYFQQKSVNLPSDLDQYQQDLLQVKFRDDAEIFQLYKMMHDHYNNYGGIQEQHWLNLYKSLRSMQIDNISVDDKHPGYLSQIVYLDYLKPELEKKLKTQ